MDPATGEETPDACVRACYDCLLSFSIQFDHALLDRTAVVPVLRGLAEVATLDLRGPDEPSARRNAFPCRHGAQKATALGCSLISGLS